MDAENTLPAAEAIKALALLGVEGSASEIVEISTEGLGESLPERVPALFDRKQQKLVSVRPLIEEYRGRPERRLGTAKMGTLASFIELVQRHQDFNSAIFADMNWQAPKFQAVIDYHMQAANDHQPRNLKHRIEYAFPLSEEWKAWVGSNGKMMPQGDFAAFVEDRIADLAAPSAAETEDLERRFQTHIADPAEIMQLSRGLQVTVDSKVKQAKVLQSGEAEVIFEEVHRDVAGNKLTIPGLFMISVPVFFRGAVVRAPARLRYRIKEGSIFWAFQMWRPDAYVTEQIRKDLDAVAVETGLPTYEGAPEAVA